VHGSARLVRAKGAREIDQRLAQSARTSGEEYLKKKMISASHTNHEVLSARRAGKRVYRCESLPFFDRFPRFGH
jgi:hypothetical protein